MEKQWVESSFNWPTTTFCVETSFIKLARINNNFFNEKKNTTLLCRRKSSNNILINKLMKKII